MPLDCLAKRGLDIAGVDVPFGIRADAPFAAAFTDIKLVAGAAAAADALKCSEVMP